VNHLLSNIGWGIAIAFDVLLLIGGLTLVYFWLRGKIEK
jgi:hypothetical protein